QVNGGPLNDPTAILYVRTADLDNQGKLKPGVPVEPLILRANAGDCIALTLRNRLPNFGTPLPALDGYNTLPMIVDQFNNNHIRPSRKVGLHAQLLEYDVTNSDGANVGVNPVQTADPARASPTSGTRAGCRSSRPAGCWLRPRCPRWKRKRSPRPRTTWSRRRSSTARSTSAPRTRSSTAPRVRSARSSSSRRVRRGSRTRTRGRP